MRLAVFLISLMLSVLLCEAGLRVFSPQKPVVPARGTGLHELFRLDREYGLTLVPNYNGTFVRNTRVTTDSLGLRDRQFGPKEPGEVRILCLGDSQTFGWGVEAEDAYPKVMERELRAKFPGTFISVINAGIPSYGTRQTILDFQRLRGPLAPDFVIATFTASNDVDDNALLPGETERQARAPAGFWVRHSHLVRFVGNSTSGMRYFLRNRDPKKIDLTIELLRKLEHDLDTAGIPCLMVIVPARHQIRPDVNAGSRLLFGLGLRVLLLRQNERIRRHFEEDSIPCLDLLSAMKTADSAGPIFFPDDSHFNPAGHLLVAGNVLQKIEPRIAAIVEARASRW